MLVLTRRPHERVLLPAILTAIEVTAIRPGLVRLGIEAPPEITVLREEVYRRGDAVNTSLPVAATAEARLVRVEALLRQRLRNVMLAVRLARQQGQSSPSEAQVTLSLLEGEVQELCREARGLFGHPAPGDGADVCDAMRAG